MGFLSLVFDSSLLQHYLWIINLCLCDITFFPFDFSVWICCFSKWTLRNSLTACLDTKSNFKVIWKSCVLAFIKKLHYLCTSVIFYDGRYCCIDRIWVCFLRSLELLPSLKGAAKHSKFANTECFCQVFLKFKIQIALSVSSRLWGHFWVFLTTFSGLFQLCKKGIWPQWSPSQTSWVWSCPEF